MFPSYRKYRSEQTKQQIGGNAMTSAIHEPTLKKEQPTHPRLRVALWIVQALLAVMFGMAGFMKATQPIAQLSQMLPFAGQVPEWLVRFIGTSELAGALGLLLPAATRVWPALTPAAASGLVLVMILAACFHISRGEFANLPVNFVLGSLAAFVVWGRSTRAKISPR
jgi:uncharacterized membrane protein YphA (DoxX/SURF4 family)